MKLGINLSLSSTIKQRTSIVDATELSALLAQLRAGNSHLGTGNITGSVTANRTSGVAPLGVIFDATATTTALTAIPFHELIHIFHYGDDDLAVWGYGTLQGVSKKNLGEGGMGAHVFETPGTRTVKYTAAYLSSGGVLSVSATQTITITITDPNVVFAGANTICLANGTVPVPGVNGVPAGATCASATTWAAVIGYCTAGKRVLLKAGDVWTVGTNTNFSGGVTGHLGRFGSGANPKVSITAAAVALIRPTTSTTEDWRFVDIESEATALASNAASNATRFLECLNTSAGGSIGGAFSTLLRINHHHASSIAHAHNDTILADCNADNLGGAGGNVGFWVAWSSRIAILGCSFNDASNMEFNIRLQGVKKCVIADCLIKDPQTNATKNALSIRGFSNGATWTGDYTEHVVVRNNVITGNAQYCLLFMGPQDAASDQRVRDVLVEGNYIHNNTYYSSCIGNRGSTNCTYRNNLLKWPVGAAGATGISLENGSSIAANSFAILPASDCHVYNNVMYCEATNANIAASLVNLTTTNIRDAVVKNNVLYLPNYTNAGKKVVALVAGATYTASNNTVDANIASTSPNFVATPPVAYTDWRCTSGYSVNGGTWVPVYTDFFGEARVGTYDMGAINP